jgi:hypothetical protein
MADYNDLKREGYFYTPHWASQEYLQGQLKSGRQGIFTAQYRQFKSFGKILAAKALAVFYSAYQKL